MLGDWRIGMSVAARSVSPTLRLDSRNLGRMKTAMIIAAISIPVCSGIIGCTPVGQARGETMLEVISPDGAIAPEGLSAIKKGMTQEEVLQILNPLYAVEHAAQADRSDPIGDFFTYKDGGETKYGDVYYVGPLVLAIRFGYSKTFVIE